MIHELPKLPYAINALEPFISQKTIEFHYGKHHQAYVNNLNKLIVGTEFENATLEVWNHTFYWNCLKPQGGGEPTGAIGEAIVKNFGSFTDFKEKFSAAAATLFGSGWAWLVKKEDGNLAIVQESNAGNPMKAGMVPLLTCDVWEHAYYLDKQNVRPDYIADFWKLVDWSAVSGRL